MAACSTLERLIELYPHAGWNKYSVSANPCVRFAFLRQPEYAHLLNFGAMSKNPSLTWEDVQSTPFLGWNYYELSRNPALGWDVLVSHFTFVCEHLQSLHRATLTMSSNPNVTLERVKEHPHAGWDIRGLSYNQSIRWADAVREFPGWDWIRGAFLDKELMCDVLRHFGPTVEWSSVYMNRNLRWKHVTSPGWKRHIHRLPDANDRIAFAQMIVRVLDAPLSQLLMVADICTGLGVRPDQNMHHVLTGLVMHPRLRWKHIRDHIWNRLNDTEQRELIGYVCINPSLTWEDLQDVPWMLHTGLFHGRHGLSGNAFQQDPRRRLLAMYVIQGTWRAYWLRRHVERRVRWKPVLLEMKYAPGRGCLYREALEHYEKLLCAK